VMAECSASKKWSCSFCTYLNYDASIKCTLCATPRSGCLTIEQIACLSPNGTAKESAVVSDDRWGCPSCTYLNCLRTKKCVQCLTDRPLRYGSDPAVNLSVIDCSGKSSPITATTSLAKELNKWMCPTCTFSNWPNALRCTMCASPRQGNRSQITTSRPHTPISPSRSKPFTDEVDSVSAVFSSTAIQGVMNSPTEPLSQGPLDLYQRRFAVGSSTEALFFKAASAIGSRDIQMVNVVVEYLINEGNVARRLTGFESRLLNTRSGGIRYEKGDSLIDLAKKCDCPDLVKLMKRVAPFDDKLPCAVNCASRARIWAKIAQLIAFRNGVFNAQFIAHPYNFNILKLPLKESDCNMEIMKCIVKPSPGIPPSFVHLDCFDMVGGSVVGRPMSVVMKNRMDAQSLLDAVFQTMFGVCDRFNLLRSALKYTLTRSSHHFKPRWVERTQRMYRECGMSVDDNSLELEWEEIIGSVSDDAEPFEPIHIWALSHVVCRPIIVVSMEENTNVAELQNLEYIPPKERSPAHHFDGIYLPTLWNAAPVTRSPLIIGHQNGLFYAFVITDGKLYYHSAHFFHCRTIQT
jgi:hypothetical protein